MKIIFILLFFVSLNLSSQTFELYLGDSTFNRGLNSIELPDSTFIVSGSYVDSDSIQKSYLVRVSSSGEIIWEKKYSTPYGIVLLDNDSGFNICYNIGDSISITKLNNHGTVQWTNYISTHLYRENATSFAKYPAAFSILLSGSKLNERAKA